MGLQVARKRDRKLPVLLFMCLASEAPHPHPTLKKWLWIERKELGQRVELKEGEGGG